MRGALLAVRPDTTRHGHNHTIPTVEGRRRKHADTERGHHRYAATMALLHLCVLASIVLAAVSLHRQEGPLWLGVSGLTISLLWVAVYMAIWVWSALS